MTDIVERLRKLDTATCEDAADEIERLRSGMLKMASTMSTQVETIERLLAALRIAEIGMSEMGMLSNARYKEVCAALRGE